MLRVGSVYFRWVILWAPSLSYMSIDMAGELYASLGSPTAQVTDMKRCTGGIYYGTVLLLYYAVAVKLILQHDGIYIGELFLYVGW